MLSQLLRKPAPLETERLCASALQAAETIGRSAQRANLALVRAALRDPPALHNPPREK